MATLYRPMNIAMVLFAAPLCLPLAAAGLVAGFVPTAASAQEVSRVDPYVVVFTMDQTPIRSGFSTIYYPICFPKPGDTLVVDAETAGWLRVRYPANVRPIVNADEAEATAAGVVRLVKPSRLKALNAVGGVKGSFQPVLDTDASPGTEFKLHEAVNDDSGKPIAFVINPPASARGWVSRDAVRRATDTESAPVLALLNAEPVNPPAPAPATLPPAPAPTPATPPAATSEPQPAPAVPTPSPAAPVPAEPVIIQPVTPVPAPAQPVVIPTTPVNTPPGMEIPRTIPVGDKDGPARTGPGSGTTPTIPAIPAGPATIESVKSLYDRVRAQPLASAELDQAIAEFERYKAGLGTSARDGAVRKQIDAYLQILNMRRDLRAMQASNADVARDSELVKSPVWDRIVELERQRVYNVIGRLVRSTVYNGDRAPVLYRVMSPEPGSARTLGYLLPDEKFEYSNKLEQVVGIIGTLRPDESLRTNLIIPTRVDVVSLAPLSASPNLPGLVRPATAPANRPVPANNPPAADPGPSPTSPAMPQLPSSGTGTILPPRSEPEKP